jgi:hypothetical protein
MWSQGSRFILCGRLYQSDHVILEELGLSGRARLGGRFEFVRLVIGLFYVHSSVWEILE